MKNSEVLLDAIGDVDDKLIPELSGNNNNKKKNKRRRLIKKTVIGGMCAAAAIACVVFLPDIAKKTEAMQLAAAVYPDMPPYPDENNPDLDIGKAYTEWSEGRRKINNQPAGYKEGFDSFLKKSTEIFLNGKNTENKLYSPLGLYMALGMTAEVTEGNSRAQILDVLGDKDIDTLRAHSKSMWLANYVDDGLGKSILANSFWTNSERKYKQDTLDAVAENYYASAYTGIPGTDGYDKLLRDWLNTQTDNLLNDYVSDIKMNPAMMLTLVSTVNYSAKWDAQFFKEDTKKDTFHSPSEDVNCEFMNHRNVYMSCYAGKKFASVMLPMEENGSMRILLPDEGTTPEELLSDDEALSCMLMDTLKSSYKEKCVNLSIPKFDIESGIDLKEGLAGLGITDVLDPLVSDFSPLTDDCDGVYISKAEQDNRVMIDEEGCKAVSLTIIAMADSAMEMNDEPTDFKIDRPFIFEILGESGLPVFVGIVNNPEAAQIKGHR